MIKLDTRATGSCASFGLLMVGVLLLCHLLPAAIAAGPIDTPFSSLGGQLAQVLFFCAGAAILLSAPAPLSRQDTIGLLMGFVFGPVVYRSFTESPGSPVEALVQVCVSGIMTGMFFGCLAVGVCLFLVFERARQRRLTERCS